MIPGRICHQKRSCDNLQFDLSPLAKKVSEFELAAKQHGPPINIFALVSQIGIIQQPLTMNSPPVFRSLKQFLSAVLGLALPGSDDKWLEFVSWWKTALIFGTAGSPVNLFEIGIRTWRNLLF